MHKDLGVIEIQGIKIRGCFLGGSSTILPYGFYVFYESYNPYCDPSAQILEDLLLFHELTWDVKKSEIFGWFITNRYKKCLPPATSSLSSFERLLRENLESLWQFKKLPGL